MELAAAILIGEGLDPVAVSPGGKLLLSTEEWKRLSAAAGACLSEESATRILSVPKQQGRSSWLVCVTPMIEPESGCNGSHLLLVFDPEPQPCLPAAALQPVFRLTKAEVRLVEQLLLGRTPKEAAEELGVTIHTVRTYLKRLYIKLGVKSQAMLVRKLMQAASLPQRPAA